MKTETVLKTLVSFIHLMRLIAQEDFIESCCCESFISYMAEGKLQWQPFVVIMVIILVPKQQ
jgi:hypothetical protein